MVHEEWLLTRYRAAIHVPTATAVAADLHLGYAQARGRRGDALPWRALAEELADLRTLAELQGVRRLVLAGDFTHAGMDETLLAEFVAWLAATRLEVVAWVLGNHDRKGAGVACLPGSAEAYILGTWKIVHGDDTLPNGRCVFGHYHPCLHWRGARAPCYLIGQEQLVLPAFSRDAAGVNVLRDNRWARHRCCAIVGERILDYGPVADLAAHCSPPRRTRKQTRPGE